MTDPIDLSFGRHAVESGQREAHEELNATVEMQVGVTKGTFYLIRRSGYRCRIRDSPMGGHRMAGPDRADFVRCVVADGEDEIHVRRVGFCELIPGFATSVTGWNPDAFELFDGARIHLAGRMAAGAECVEAALSALVERCFGHDGAR